MRSIKLVPALVAAALLLSLAPAGASAAPAARAAAAGGKCKLKLEAPGVITAGESVLLHGNVECPPAAASVPTEVAIHARPAPAGIRAETVAGKVTTTNGKFELTVTPTVNTIYVAFAPGAGSAFKVVRVAPVVKFGPGTPADGSQLLTGAGAVVGVKHVNRPESHAVTFTGTVTPSRAGQFVVLQREAAYSTEEWVPIASGRINANHEFTIKHIFRGPGEANIRVVAQPTRTYWAGASEVRNYVISQPQNPNLTINVSRNPLVFGEKAEITGVAKGVANGTVTLLAHNAGTKLAAVSTAKTDSGGNYKFTQTPEKNTFYRVIDATEKSAVVFEGVKFVLTPGAPPSTTVQAGTALTLSGTVTPKRSDLAGHPIYLEHQGAAHPGFWVSQVGQVSANGEYSISRAFFLPGTVKLRVKIPGDPENQGATTPPLTVTITPAPPGSLPPELPAKEPSQGRL